MSSVDALECQLQNNWTSRKMISRRIFYGVLLFVLVTLRVSDAACGDGTFTKEFGSASCRWDGTKVENVSWTFQPPSNRTDVVFVLKIIHYNGTGRNDYPFNINISLPDGQRSNTFDVIPQRFFWSETDVWCGMYVKSGTPGEQTCDVGAKVNGACDVGAGAASEWPPKISADLTQFQILATYEFLDCPQPNIIAHEPTPAKPTTTTKQPATVKRVLTKAPAPASTPPSGAPSSLQLMVVVIFLTVLLFIVLGVLIIVLCTCRKPPASQVQVK